MAIAIPRHRFTVDEYHTIGATGALGYDQRMELIEGEIVDMPPIGRKHAACVDELTDLFARGLAGRARIRVQGPLRLNDRAEPQPDLVVLRPRADSYREADAGPADALLVIEVADTTVDYDQRVKVPLYAEAGIPEVWVADVNAESVTVYRQPGPQGYAQVLVATGDDPLSPLAFPDLVVTPARLFR
jgi:Uma2 family endonuclease